MHYAQFYQTGICHIDGKPGRIMPACGDRAVIILDGRERLASRTETARQECIKRGYCGFSLHSGESFTRSSVYRLFEHVTD